MNDDKEQLQAQHRQQETEAREKLRERKSRTRRLIEHGAILESLYPEAVTMDGETLKAALEYIFRRL